MLESPATIAPKWMHKCAGVQNVSRPIDMCHEISQNRPTVVAVTAIAEDHTYQGIEAARSRTAL
jgi:hypothetical protein